MRYLHDDLKYTSDLQYYMGGHTGRWDTARDRLRTRGYPSEIESLRLAMAKDPYLHVMVGAGLLRHGDAVRERRVHVHASRIRPDVQRPRAVQVLRERPHGVPESAVGETAQGRHRQLHHVHRTSAADGDANGEPVNGFRSSAPHRHQRLAGPMATQRGSLSLLLRTVSGVCSY